MLRGGGGGCRVEVRCNVNLLWFELPAAIQDDEHPSDCWLQGYAFVLIQSN